MPYPEPSCASAIADPATNPPGPSVAPSPAVAAVAVPQDQQSPAFLATIVQAVKDALAADRAPTRSVPNASSQPSTLTMLGGVPVSSSNLASQASAFLTSGTGVLPTSASSASQGRPSYVVPSFISTFPISSPVVSLPSCAFGTSLSASVSSLSSLPALQQPFVVGPGFSPIPAKLVGQIVAGKFVDLSELLSSNIASAEPEPQLYFEGRLVLTSTPKKPKRRLQDITSWLEAFSIYCLILASHFPHRWKDLMNYQLLILRTH